MLRSILNRLIITIAVAFAFASCSKLYRMEGNLMVYVSQKYVVASKQPYYWYDSSFHPYYLIKSEGSDKWESCNDILGFDYSEGKEYRIIAEKVVDTEQYKWADDYPGEYLRLVKIISYEEKESSNLPKDLIYTRDNPEPLE